MKINKTLIAAALLGGALLNQDGVRAQNAITNTMAVTNLPAGTNALVARPIRSPRQARSEILARRLALTADQKTKAQPILDEIMQQLTELRTKAGVGVDRQAKSQEIWKAHVDKLKDILTPSQLEQCEQLLIRGPVRPKPINVAPVAPTNNVKPQP